MLTIDKVLGKEDKFFEFLEQSAEDGRTSVRALIKYLQDPAQLKNLSEFSDARRDTKELRNKISEELCRAHVTTLEREEIEALSVALYKIPKTIEKIAERITLAPHYLKSLNLSRQMALMVQATDTLLAMLRDLKKGIHLERITALNDQLQATEGEADRALLNLLRDLYATPNTPARAVFLKDILELQEKVFDRCRDAGNIINHIVLKNT